jgi:hypothetical protein
MSVSSSALAIEPDAAQARILERMLDGNIGGALRVVGSTEDAFASFGSLLPDLILLSPFLPPNDEERILEHLIGLGGNASHVQVLSIPRFGDGQPTAEKKRWFGGLARKAATAGADPAAFASEVFGYLAQASSQRQRHSSADIVAPVLDQEEQVDELPDFQLEHVEELLDRLDADTVEEPSVETPPSADMPMSAPDPDRSSTDSAGTTPGEAIATRDEMTMPTAHEVTIDVHEGGDARVPRFLTPDERVPMPLRALLEEADGCLKMSFLTGAGACAARTLDLMLSEQGFGGTDRADQIQQLGKKHPSIGDSFLRGLSLVTTNPSGAWDEPRVRLAIAILKAIAYEIYVLGPERKERAAYVLELLERFKSAGKA